MSNINKVLITIVACVFMICVASVSIVSIVTSKEEKLTTTTAAEAQNTTVAEPGTTEPSLSQSTASGTTTASAQSTTTTTQAAASTTTTQAALQSSTGELSVDILGKWMDSAGMSGWEFMEGGKVSWTYVDLAQFSVPFNGKTSGLYTLEGDTLTVKFSIYSATIKKTYKVSVKDNELSMYDLEEHETSTYIKQA